MSLNRSKLFLNFFRELKIGEKGKVYVAASKMGEGYAWVLSGL